MARRRVIIEPRREPEPEPPKPKKRLIRAAPKSLEEEIAKGKIVVSERSIAPGFPATLFGNIAPPPGVLRLIWYPMGPPVWNPPADGWLIRAQSEKKVPVDQRSSTTVSHFYRMIDRDYRLWTGPGGRRELTPDEEIDIEAKDNRWSMDHPRWRPYPTPWLAAECTPWLLTQCLNAGPPLRRLQPMVRSPEEEERLRILFTMEKKGQIRCVMARPRPISLREAQDILDFPWAGNLEGLHQAWQTALAKYDFRRFGPSKEQWATEMQEKANNAFYSILARRFVNKRGFDDIPLTPEQQKAVSHFVKWLLEERARKIVYKRLDANYDPEKGKITERTIRANIDHWTRVLYKELMQKRPPRHSKITIDAALLLQLVHASRSSLRGPSI